MVLATIATQVKDTKYSRSALETLDHFMDVMDRYSALPNVRDKLEVYCDRARAFLHEIELQQAQTTDASAQETNKSLPASVQLSGTLFLSNLLTPSIDCIFKLFSLAI